MPTQDMFAYCSRGIGRGRSDTIYRRSARTNILSTSRNGAIVNYATTFLSRLAVNVRPQSTTSGSRKKRIVVAVTGATGSPLAISLLKRLRQENVETHLVMSTWAVATLKYELDTPNDCSSYLSSLASFTYSPKDVSASLSSGSFRTDGMIVVPCSMKTLAAVRMGYDNDLITRAASVTLKEKRRLVLAVRETPLSSIHLENMLRLSDAGAVVMPPVMAFYTRPKSIADMVEQSTKRMMDLLGFNEETDETEEQARVDIWTGFDWDRKHKDCDVLKTTSC